MQASGDILKKAGAKLNGGLSLRNGEVSETDCGLAVAIFGWDVRGHPLQGGGAAGVEAHPLRLVGIDRD